MARINYQRKPCKKVYQTSGGPRPCGQGALRGKDYCAKHRPMSNTVQIYELESLINDGVAAARGALVIMDSYFVITGVDPTNNDNYCRLLDWIAQGGIRANTQD